ncbi:ATP-binding protein [Bacillus canaveralius]|uniref:ATP-binding protein n=1 Tax=Bacillus canaveralius TaxID=1403243 RepID=UPI000F777E5B|nr:ATP-binding protein [Bacillus canaveralius]RSK52592.1 ATP-binding protein [Bacillus canaveralius]
MRDALILPFNERESLVIASDNSGGIGLKEHDIVHVPYGVVSYYGFRVAAMECIAAGGAPLAVIIHNFSGDSAWEELIIGIKQGLRELELDHIPISGSTESNFQLLQSAAGIIVVGSKLNKTDRKFSLSDDIGFAVIGQPLVGDQVVEQPESIAPLQLFQWCTEQDEVKEVMPVGSKGIFHELLHFCDVKEYVCENNLDLQKSSGPSTCFLIAYSKNGEEKLRRKAADLFSEIQLKG